MGTGSFTVIYKPKGKGKWRFTSLSVTRDQARELKSWTQSKYPDDIIKVVKRNELREYAGK